MTWVAVGVGAALGAWLRWWLGIWLNSALNQLPLGTLAANLVGGYIIGMAVAFFSYFPALSLEWRLFVITGFLGGLTTFSSFSSEAMSLLLQGQFGWALVHSSLHLFGSIGCCIAGFATFKWLVG